MRIPSTRSRIAATAGIALLAISSSARAQQTDTNPPPPNVLILLDNSGSMERMIDGAIPEDEGNSCNVDPVSGKIFPPSTPLPSSACTSPPCANRWGTLIQALTGTFQNHYSCVSMPRASGSQFASEYQINGVKPYDADYYLNYHRPVMVDADGVTSCVVAPGALPGANVGTGVGPSGSGSGNNGPGAGKAATDFPPDGIILRPYSQLAVTSNPTTGACSQFPSKQYSTYQFQDGAIPSSTQLMRFGLMTFDQDPSPLIGVSVGANPLVVGATTTDAQTSAFGAFAGMWSYFPGWNTGAACTAFGYPANCTTPSLLAVGARNPAAPPWEGRMMPFPATNDLATQQTNNQNISNVILAARPYGATPLAGMLTSAEYYLWNDPTGPEMTDTFVHCGQRPEYVILLTDGQPNLDMRTACADPTGHCPYKLPEDIALELNAATSGNAHSVTTFVLGFAVSTIPDGSNTACSSLVSSGNLAAVCAGNNPAYTACCELQRIALAGSQNNPVRTPAYFADTPGDLQKALNDILAQIASHATTRTTPAFAPSVQASLADPSTPTTAAEVFLASFNPSPGLPWTGDITRTRDQCSFGTSQYTVKQVSNPAQGDDFGQNLNSHSGPGRTFIAFQPDVEADGSTIDATTTIRPYVSTTVGDGIGKYSATTYVGQATNVIPNLSATALGISAGQCSYNSTTTHAPVKPGLTPAGCATMTLDYTFGQPSFSGNPGDFPFVSRYNAALGDIYHASPAVVPPPNSQVQDPSYAAFETTWQGRQQIVYAATNDGLLHAFWADETKLENNEVWAMLLPGVMKNLYPTYPSSHSLLLDGSPVVKDVPWDRRVGPTTSGLSTNWHTMLVASFGSSNLGYYAVDVTQPDPTNLPNATVPQDNPGPPGPNFRWQLTKMPATNYPIFGAHAGTPALTTLFMNPGDGGGTRAIGVAILPGGSDPAPTAAAQCARATKTTDSAPIGSYAARQNVRCWGSKLKATDPVNGRSLAVVRADTGEILQVFARKADVTAYPADTLLAANRIRNTALDSPMTGKPIIYPNDVATNATKVFIADADGTMWKFNLSNPDPTLWTGELYLDLYNGTVDTNATSWSDGQPVQVSPTLALDQAGEVVLNIGTGTTDSFDSNGINFVYSVTEKVQGTTPKLRAFVNWYLGSPLTPPSSILIPPSPQLVPSSPALLPGERVAGPMTVFDGKLYFATYAAAPTPPPGQPVTTCANSTARIWSLDFVNPGDPNCSAATSIACNRSIGGIPMLELPPPQSPTAFVANVTPSATDATLANAVIPGLAINETPACVGGGAPSSDNYVAGSMHTDVSNYTPGSYAITAQIGKTNPTGTGTQTFTSKVQTPISPTQIDSWAAVLE